MEANTEANMPVSDLIPTQEIWRKIADPILSRSQIWRHISGDDRNMEKNMEANMERFFLESKGHTLVRDIFN